MEEANRREDAVLLMTHPGIGPVTSTSLTEFNKQAAKFQQESLRNHRIHSFNKLCHWFGPGGRCSNPLAADHFFN